MVVASETSAVEERRCQCGCGAVVNRSFKAGHDQRHKGNLLRAWDDGQGALAEELVDRGWYTWEQLEERQAKRLAKATKNESTSEEEKEETSAANA